MQSADLGERDDLPGCRAQKLSLRHFPWANYREKLPLREVEAGGRFGGLGNAGHYGILQAEGVAGG